MVHERCIRWRGEDDVRAQEYSSQATEGVTATTRAYRRRPSTTDSSPLDGDKLRRQESYPSSHILASTESMQSSITSESSPSSSSFTQDEKPIDPRPTPSPHDISPPVLPATSRDFAELFPSSKKLLIRHDDTTFDGNMNLRIDSPITTFRGNRRDITLYHLRMYDLRCRDFSLRRYCRDSGREVCHCARKSHKPMLGARPNIRRSLSSAFAAMLPKHDSKTHHTEQKPAHLRRQDSGYDTMHSDKDEEEADDDRPHSSHSSSAPAKDTSDLINLEFSNYAHLDLKRRGFKADKRYDFDYWGVSYSWHRSTQKLGTAREISYHLTRRDGSLVARMVPELLSEDETLVEVDKGGWIRPYSIRITDKKINDERLADVADVVISTGLIALVDDCIRRHFHQRDEHRHGFYLPVVKGRLHRKMQGGPGDATNGSADTTAFPHRQLLADSL